jgi:DNA-binding GntR family transcriptional regulator
MPSEERIPPIQDLVGWDSSLNAAQKWRVVYDWLLQELRTGQYPFGVELSIQQIASRFGISRRPVLDAIKRLEQEHFVRIVPQTGCYVVNPTLDTIRDHFLIGSTLEGLSARLAAERRPDEAVGEIEQAAEAFAHVIEARSQAQQGILDYLKANRLFHGAVLKYCGSQELFRLVTHLWDLNDFYLINVTNLSLQEKRAVRDHFEIVRLIQQRDAEGAERAMREHLLRSILWP